MVFVDLKLGTRQLPDFFIVPSKTVFDAFDNSFFKSGTRRRWRWHPSISQAEGFKNNWSFLRNRLEGTSQKEIEQ